MNSVLEKYLDDIRAIFPFGRILLFVLVAAISVVSHDELKGPIAVQLLKLHLADLGGEGDLAKSAIFGDFVLAAIVVFAAWALYRYLSSGIIAWIWKRLAFDRRVAEQYEEYDAACVSPEKSAISLEFAKEEAKKRVVVVKRLASLAELLLGVALSLMLFSLYSGFVDALIGVVSLIAFAVTQCISIAVYLRKVLPYEIHVSAVSGLKRRLGMPDV